MRFKKSLYDWCLKIEEYLLLNLLISYLSYRNIDTFIAVARNKEADYVDYLGFLITIIVSFCICVFMIIRISEKNLKQIVSYNVVWGFLFLIFGIYSIANPYTEAFFKPLMSLSLGLFISFILADNRIAHLKKLTPE